jgi:hypothetical protein
LHVSGYLKQTINTWPILTDHLFLVENITSIFGHIPLDFPERTNMTKTIPLETLSAIAAELTLDDICHFRLVSYRWAQAGFPILFRHLQIINTLDALQDFRFLQNTPFGSLKITKSLAIYDCDWPVIFSRKFWEAHPNMLHPKIPSRAAQAFENYQTFSSRELSRDLDSDIKFFTELLQALPNLQELTLSQVHAQKWGAFWCRSYRVLQQRICAIPYFEGHMEGIASRILPILPHLPSIKALSIHGDLKPCISRIENLNLRCLRLKPLLVSQALIQETVHFLSSFPNLEELSICVASIAPPSEQELPLSFLLWPKLSRVTFKNLWVSEEDFLGFFNRHSITRLSLSEVMLTSGSWKSLFMRLRQKRLDFHGEGAFLRPNSVLFELDKENLRLLNVFLDGSSDWPFD